LSHSGGEVFGPFMLSAMVNGMLTCVLAVGVDLSAEELKTWMASGLTTPPTGTAIELARREGWIAVPHAGSLSELQRVAT
jgi:hypothetical protein